MASAQLHLGLRHARRNCTSARRRTTNCTSALRSWFKWNSRATFFTKAPEKQNKNSRQAWPASQVTKAVVRTSAFLDLLHKGDGRFRATQTKAAGAAFAATIVLQQEVPQLPCQRTRWEPRMICRVPVVHLVTNIIHLYTSNPKPSEGFRTSSRPSLWFGSLLTSRNERMGGRGTNTYMWLYVYVCVCGYALYCISQETPQINVKLFNSDWSRFQKSNFEDLLVMLCCSVSDWSTLQKSHLEMFRCQILLEILFQKLNFEDLPKTPIVVVVVVHRRRHRMHLELGVLHFSTSFVGEIWNQWKKLSGITSKSQWRRNEREGRKEPKKPSWRGATFQNL